MMWQVLLAGVIIQATMGSGPEAASEVKTASTELVAELSKAVQPGSLIFSQGDCMAVKVFSGSSYTHVGGVVIKDGQPHVYDCMNGVGVRQTPLSEYLRLQTPSRIHVVHPTKPFTAAQLASFESHLRSQVGRKYAIKHFVSGRRCDGLHCAEFMTDALMSAELIRANNPPRVSPGSLLEGLEKPGLYTDGGRFILKEAEISPPTEQTWCQRLWHDTGTCCSNTATQLRRWIMCR